MNSQEKINKAKELNALAVSNDTPEGWDKVYFEQFRRAWREAAAAIKAEVAFEFSKHSATFQRQQVAMRLTAEGLPQNVGMEWA